MYVFSRLEPSKVDLDVLRAIEVCDISPVSYPYTFSWQKHVLSYNDEERKRFVDRYTMVPIEVRSQNYVVQKKRNSTAVK